MLKLQDIYIYPIKSLGGIRLNSAKVEERGFQYDRRWMLLNEKGRFLTQRQIPEMALLQPRILENGLEIIHKGKELAPLLIPFDQTNDQRLTVSVWGDECEAVFVSKEVDLWFSNALGRKCHLVYMPDVSKRLVDTDFAPNGEIVSFADGYPFLVIGQASLDLLNQKLEAPIDMLRFRPNLVFSGGTPHIEDDWKKIQIGDIKFMGVKPCARCAVPNINPQTAEKENEPTQTLKKYRQNGTKILFGQNLLIDYQGSMTLDVETEIKVF